MINIASDWLDRLATIKAGLITAITSGALAMSWNIDWLAVIAAISASLTGAAALVRIYTDVARHKRERKLLLKDRARGVR